LSTLQNVLIADMFVRVHSKYEGLFLTNLADHYFIGMPLIYQKLASVL